MLRAHDGDHVRSALRTDAAAANIRTYAKYCQQGAVAATAPLNTACGACIGWEGVRVALTQVPSRAPPSYRKVSHCVKWHPADGFTPRECEAVVCPRGCSAAMDGAPGNLGCRHVYSAHRSPDNLLQQPARRADTVASNVWINVSTIQPGSFCEKLRVRSAAKGLAARLLSTSHQERPAISYA